MKETWVRSLGWKDSLEKKMATHSCFLAWEIHWREEPGGLLSMGSQRVGHGRSNLAPYLYFPSYTSSYFSVMPFIAKKKSNLLVQGSIQMTLHSVMSSQPCVFDDLAIFRSTGQLFYVTSFNLGLSHDSSQ